MHWKPNALQATIIAHYTYLIHWTLPQHQMFSFILILILLPCDLVTAVLILFQHISQKWISCTLMWLCPGCFNMHQIWSGDWRVQSFNTSCIVNFMQRSNFMQWNGWFHATKDVIPWSQTCVFMQWINFMLWNVCFHAVKCDE